MAYVLVSATTMLQSVLQRLSYRQLFIFTNLALPPLLRLVLRPKIAMTEVDQEHSVVSARQAYQGVSRSVVGVADTTLHNRLHNRHSLVANILPMMAWRRRDGLRVEIPECKGGRYILQE
jgi:hypothetical protein